MNEPLAWESTTICYRRTVMTPTLSPEQIAEIEAKLEKATQGPWSADSTVFFGDIERARDVSLLVALRNAAPALIAMAKRPKWLCFNCGFETSDEAEAEAHFGDGDGSPAICRWWYEEADEAIRLRAYQEEVVETAGAREAEYQERLRAEKAEAKVRSMEICCDSYAEENQQFHDRFTKAEAERDRYREMAVRLATSIDRHGDVTVEPTSADHDLWDALDAPDIAALLEEESNHD